MKIFVVLITLIFTSIFSNIVLAGHIKDAQNFLSKHDYDSAIITCNLYLETSTTPTWKKAFAQSVLGYAYMKKNNDGKSLIHYYDALITLRNSDTIHHYLEAEILNMIGLTHKRFNSFARAIHYYDEALKITKESKDKNEVLILYNKARAQAEIKNPETRSTYQSALNLAEKYELERWIINSNNQIGVLLTEVSKELLKNGEVAKAMSGFSQARDYLLRVNSSEYAHKHVKYKAFANHNLGELYLIKEQFELAKTYFEAALNLKKELNPKYRFNTLISLGELSMRKMEVEEAIYHWKSAIEYIDFVKLNNKNIEVFNHLRKAYELTGDTKNVLHYTLAHNSWLVRLSEESENARRLHDQYKYEQLVFNLEEKLKRREVQDQINYYLNFYTLTAVLGILLVISIAIHRFIKSNQKGRRVMKKLKDLEL